MSYKYVLAILLAILIAAASLVGLSRMNQSREKYEVDKSSPNGLYRVKIEFREDKKSGTRDYTERLKVQYFKSEEVVSAN